MGGSRPETVRGQRTTNPLPRLTYKGCVIDLALVDEHMRVGVRGHGEVSLANVLADSGRRLAPEGEQRDSPVPRVMRGEGRHAGGGAGARDRSAQPVGRNAEEDARSPDSVVSRDEI